METGPLRIGNVSFTNAEPYRLVAPQFDVTWIQENPSVLARMMASRELDACLLPTGALPELRGKVRPVGPFGIGCRGRVLSLRLFSKVRIAELVEPERTVYITPRTTTTRAMLGELFQMQYGCRPRLTVDRGDADAVLLIGDEAMDQDREEFRWPLGRDMCAWWFEQTGMSFVFAQWAVGAHVNAADEAKLRAWVEDNLAAAATAEGRRRLEAAGVRAGWSAAMARLYFDRLDYHLDAEHLRGLQHFQHLLKARDGAWQ